MNLKKIIILMVVCIFAMSSLTFAARGGSRLSAPRPSISRTTPSFSTQQKKPSDFRTKEYKPSQDAKSINKNAPATAKLPLNAARSSSPWGGIMRNIGLFAGGMFLGGLLSHFLGMGSMGMFSDIMGLLFNIILICMVIMVIRMIWYKFKNRSGQGTNPYRREDKSSNSIHQTSSQEDFMDVTPPQIRGNDYNSKTKADEYRRR
ncbi:hypothetical protein [Pectinatus sottacetonis]|uniref:hypothetical protein n=1 Tax=Pectinatus sottacetonis TaxID=1002795 RepID=UPI0018C7A9ED|nr:hypothetical protein [Pectinatus sottacetonis]